MERSFMKKTMNIFFCALLGAAVLIGGCSDNNKAEAVKEQKTAAAAQKVPAFPVPVTRRS